jgi:hypothetical protein
MQHAINLLLDKKEWAQFDIELVDMTSEDKSKFEKQIGVDNLFAALVKRQSAAWIGVVQQILTDIQKVRDDLREKLNQAEWEAQRNDTVAQILPDFIEAVPHTYNNLASVQLYAGVKEERARYQEEGPKSNSFSPLDIRNGFEKLASDPSFGEDINEILEQCFNGQYEEFPIPEFRSNDYDEVLQQHLRDG